MHEEIKKLPREEADRVLELPNSYRDKGRVEGKAEGIVIGIEKGKEQIAYNMLKKGMSAEEISDIVGMSVSKIKEMNKNV